MRALLFAILLAGCASPFATAAQTVQSASAVNRAVGEMMVEINDDIQEGILEQLEIDSDWKRATQARDVWREKRNKVRQAQASVHFAVIGASTGLVIAGQGGNININELIKPVLDSVIALKDALSKFGIKLPTGGLF